VDQKAGANHNGNLQPSQSNQYSQWRLGKFGSSLEFGSLKRVSVGPGTYLHVLAASFTIAGWVQKNPTSRSFRPVN
jgi:hypothetical protein